jgi:hypothetical protein
MLPDHTIDELARTLFDYDPGPRSTREVTADLTRAIIGWALRHGWSARTEARIEVPDRLVAARLGYVDVVVDPGQGRPCIAIEIDSTDKPWSMEKLRYAVTAGMTAVWVRWGDREWARPDPDIDVIQLAAARQPARRPGETQLGLWS